MMRRLLSILLISLLWVVDAFCCTSVIVTSKASGIGRPVMYKNRDTSFLDNRVERFSGPVHGFVALVNSSIISGEAWAGTNDAGFAIMNTASYNLKDDDVPGSEMDREGELMFKALGTCTTLKDFENMLDTLRRPMGVETNFGVIDASGGAAYYEVNNTSWVKFDVNEEPSGYRVVTNFSFSGRKDKYSGYERYLTASAIMRENSMVEGIRFDHGFFFDTMSRNYRHELLGLDYNRKYKDYFSGTDDVYAPDQDFIPRMKTASAVVVEGVGAGGDPGSSVMWTVLGYPSCSVAFPIPAHSGFKIPEFIKSSNKGKTSELCDFSLDVKMSSIFDRAVGNGKNYFNVSSALRLGSICKKIESEYYSRFSDIFSDWAERTVPESVIVSRYEEVCSSCYSSYISQFAPFAKNH